MALMVAAGDRLYTNIFANHGPLAYALSHFWLLLTGSKDLASYRLISLALFALCAAAIYASPVLTQARARLYALMLFLVPLGVVYAATTLHMVMYQSMAGALLTVELALFSVPAIFGVTPPRWAAVAAGFAAACAVFAALSFAVSAALLAAAGIAMAPDDAGARRRAIGGFLAGALAAVLVFGLWITLFSDWTGYFVYHYWVNLTVVADSIKYSWLSPFSRLTGIEFGPRTLIHIFAVAIFYAAVIALIVLTRHRAATPARLRWSLSAAALAVGVAFFNPRGQLCYRLDFVAGVLGSARWWARFSWRRIRRDAILAGADRGGRACLGLLAVVLVLVHQFGVRPRAASLERTGEPCGAPKPSEDRVYRLIRELVPANERILAVVFVPGVYIYADRLPCWGIAFTPRRRPPSRRCRSGATTSTSART